MCRRRWKALPSVVATHFVSAAVGTRAEGSPQLAMRQLAMVIMLTMSCPRQRRTTCGVRVAASRTSKENSFGARKVGRPPLRITNMHRSSSCSRVSWCGRIGRRISSKPGRYVNRKGREGAESRVAGRTEDARAVEAGGERPSAPLEVGHSEKMSCASLATARSTCGSLVPVVV